MKKFQSIQVNIPFSMLRQGYLDRFLEYGLNPEIGLDAYSLENFARADFVEAADRFRKNGRSVTLHAPFMDLAPGSPDPAVRALTRRRFEQVLDLVPLFNPQTIVCHSGYEERRYRHMRDEWLESSLEMWRWLAAAAARTGAVLMLENVYEKGPAEMRDLFENLKDLGVGFCLDIGHQHAFSRTALSEWLERLGPYLGQLHLHDNDGSQDGHLALGMGTCDLQGLFAFLKANGPARLVATLEPHLEPDLWPSLQYLRQNGFLS